MAGPHQCFDTFTYRGRVDLPQISGMGDRHEFGDLGSNQLPVRVIQRIERFTAGLRVDQQRRGAGEIAITKVYSNIRSNMGFRDISSGISASATTGGEVVTAAGAVVGGLRGGIQKAPSSTISGLGGLSLAATSGFSISDSCSDLDRRRAPVR